MTVSTAGSKISIDNDNVDEYEGHDIVKISSKPFSSLPLFLPKYLDYDPETNMVSKISTIDNLTKKELQEGEGEESEQSNHHHLRLVPNAGLEMLQEWNTDDSDNTNKNAKQSSKCIDRSKHHKHGRCSPRPFSLAQALVGCLCEGIRFKH